MATFGYIQVSTDKQNVDSQELEIRSWADNKEITIDMFIKAAASSKLPAERRIDELIEVLEIGDTLIVTELSRLGRSLSQVVRTIDELNKRDIKLHVLKQSIHSGGDDTNGSEPVIKAGLFTILADLERTLASQTTKEGLAAARARGTRLGAKKGVKRTSKLDPHTTEIVELLKLRVPHRVIAEKFGVTRSGLNQWMKSRAIHEQLA